MPSEIRSIGPTIRRLAKGTIDLVRWRAPVQLLKYATRTVWFKNVNTGYPVASEPQKCALGGSKAAISRGIVTLAALGPRLGRVNKN